MKKIFFIVAIIVAIIIINNLAHSIYDLWQKKNLIGKAQQELTYEKQKNHVLKSQVSHVESREFIEKEARDKLLLAKEGEQQVLIPQGLVQKKVQEDKDDTPNWRKWWELFFWNLYQGTIVKPVVPGMGFGPMIFSLWMRRSTTELPWLAIILSFDPQQIKRYNVVYARGSVQCTWGS